MEIPSHFDRKNVRPGPEHYEILAAISEPTRFRIVSILLTSTTPLNVTDIMQKLGRDDLPTISRHLKTLSTTAIVTSEKAGVSKMYRIDPTYIVPVVRSLYQSLIDVFPEDYSTGTTVPESV
jgi:DNA-binding transcriptional ArsR family regulator